MLLNPLERITPVSDYDGFATVDQPTDSPRVLASRHPEIARLRRIGTGTMFMSGRSFPRTSADGPDVRAEREKGGAGGEGRVATARARSEDVRTIGPSQAERQER